jgi:hypothetical protein
MVICASCPCRLHTLAYELQLHLHLAPSSAGRTASRAAQPSAAPPAAAGAVAATASRDVCAFCVAVWAMLGDQPSLPVLFMSQTVVSWAVAHFDRSESRRDPSWTLAWAALYVPTEHVVRNAGTPFGAGQEAALGIQHVTAPSSESSQVSVHGC